MTRRRLVVIVTVLTLLTCAAVVLAYLRFRDPYPLRVFRQIKPGMSLAEVTDITGSPPVSNCWRSRGGHYRELGSVGIFTIALPDANGGWDFVKTADWDFDGGYELHAGFNAEAKLTYATLLHRYDPTLFERLRVWLSL